MRHTGTQPIPTQRLLLRPFTPADAADVYRNYAGDPEVTRYLTWNAHTSECVSEVYLEMVASRYAGLDFYDWAMELKETHQVIGAISVVDIMEDTGTAVIGYCMGRAWWGQGLMPEALRAVRDYLFDVVGFQRLEATHDADNPKSGRVMEKVGMTRVGLRRRGGFNCRGVVDQVLYDMLPEDARR